MTQLDHVAIRKWRPVLQAYEQVKKQVEGRSCKTVREVLSIHHVTKRDLYKYYRRWVSSGRRDTAFIPEKRGPRQRSRRTPKPMERLFIKAYRKLGHNSYELVLMFRPYYGTATPCARTVDRIKKRYPLPESHKVEIKRYEKSYPGEMGHTDLYELPRALSPDGWKRYVVALEDDCTRLAYAEVIGDKSADTVGGFQLRALSWFYQTYGIPFAAVLSDNGRELKGGVTHPVEYIFGQLGIEHWYSRPGRPQTNGKVEAFFKIMQNELVRAQAWKEGLPDFIDQLGKYLYDYNHCRRHGGIDYQTPFEKYKRVSELLS